VKIARKITVMENTIRSAQLSANAPKPVKSEIVEVEYTPREIRRDGLVGWWLVVMELAESPAKLWRHDWGNIVKLCL